MRQASKEGWQILDFITPPGYSIWVRVVNGFIVQAVDGGPGVPGYWLSDAA
jgi:hypothetical protein